MHPGSCGDCQFPPQDHSRKDSRIGHVAGHHAHVSMHQKAVVEAVCTERIIMWVTSRTNYHLLEKQLFEACYNTGTVQRRLRYKDVNSTRIYTQFLNRGGTGLYGPLDAI